MTDTAGKTIKTIRISEIVLWIGVALLLRLTLMFTTAHSDLIFINYFPSKLAYEGVFDIYRYISLHFPVDRVWSYYPPLTYLEIGCFQWVLRPFASGFGSWIQTVYSSGLDNWLISNGSSLSVIRYIFLMKVPYLFYDALLIWALAMMIPGGPARIRGAALWALNPVLLYGIYMFGQMDIMPSAVAALGVLLLMRRQGTWGFIFLGTAALFKTFPLFMVPPLLVVTSRSPKDFLRHSFSAALPMVIVLAPLMLSGGAEVIRSLFPKFYMEGACQSHWLLVRKAAFAVFYILLLIGANRKREKADETAILSVAAASVMVLYVMFFAPVHYFVWAMPLLIAALCSGIIPARLYWGLITLVFVYSLNGARTTTQLFAPLDPVFFLGLPGLPDMMHNIGIRWGYVMLGAELAFTALCVMTAMALAGVSPVCGKILGVRGS